METYIKVNDENKLNQLVPENIRLAYGYPLDVDIYFLDVLRAPIQCVVNNQANENSIKYFINTQLCDVDKMVNRGADVEVSQEVKNLVINFFEADQEFTPDQRRSFAPYIPLNNDFERIQNE